MTGRTRSLATVPQAPRVAGHDEDRTISRPVLDDTLVCGNHQLSPGRWTESQSHSITPGRRLAPGRPKQGGKGGVRPIPPAEPRR